MKISCRSAPSTCTLGMAGARGLGEVVEGTEASPEVQPPQHRDGETEGPKGTDLSKVSQCQIEDEEQVGLPALQKEGRHCCICLTKEETKVQKEAETC